MKKHKQIKIILLFAVAISISCLNFIKTNAVENSFAEKLKGRLLLQVQYQGQIWYVEPESLNRYQVTAENAREIFTSLAIGITNANLDTIPTAPDSLKNNQDSDKDGYPDKTEVEFGYNIFGSGKANFNEKITKRLRGKFLLQVERAGRIWYVNPQDEKKYEVRSDNIMLLFRELALGITNSDLYRINQAYSRNNDENLSEKQEELQKINEIEIAPNANVEEKNTSADNKTNDDYLTTTRLLSEATQAISQGDASKTAGYFTSDMRSSIEYTMTSLSASQRSLFADILIDADLSSDGADKKIYTTIIPFNNSYGKVEIKLKKQPDQSWLIAGL